MPDEKQPEFWEGIVIMLPKMIVYLILITMLVIARVGLNMSSEKPLSKKRMWGVAIFSWFMGVSIGVICHFAKAPQIVTIIAGPTATALGYPLATIFFRNIEKMVNKIKTIEFWKIKATFREDENNKQDVA